MKLIQAHLISIFLRLNSIILHILNGYNLLFSLLPAQVLFVEQVNVVLDALTYHPSHQHPAVRSKRDILFFYWAVVEASGGLDRIAMRYIAQDNRSGSCFFELCHSEDAAVVSKHAGFCG